MVNPNKLQHGLLFLHEQDLTVTQLLIQQGRRNMKEYMFSVDLINIITQ